MCVASGLPLISKSMLINALMLEGVEEQKNIYTYTYNMIAIDTNMSWVYYINHVFLVSSMSEIL